MALSLQRKLWNMQQILQLKSHLYVVHVIKEFGELIQRLEQHDSYVEEVKRLSKDLLHECESRARELGVTK
jgi:hypothetical protein